MSERNEADDNLEERQWLAVVGEHIRSLRSKRNLSQVSVAVRAGFATAYYSSIERGERNVSTINLVKLASALDVEVGALFPPLSYLTGRQDQEVSSTEGSDAEVKREGRIAITTEVEHEDPLEYGNTPVLVSAGAAAILLKVSRRTIERWARDGVLQPAAKVEDQRGKLYSLFRREDIDRMLTARYASTTEQHSPK